MQHIVWLSKLFQFSFTIFLIEVVEKIHQFDQWSCYNFGSEGSC